MGVHPGGIAIMAPKAVFRLVKVCGADPRAANIVKQEMLARGGDAAVPASVSDFDLGPADLLLAGTLSQYADLIEKLYRQPFYNMPHLAAELGRVLAATAPGWRAPVRAGDALPAPADPPPLVWGEAMLNFEVPRLGVHADHSTDVPLAAADVAEWRAQGADLLCASLASSTGGGLPGAADDRRQPVDDRPLPVLACVSTEAFDPAQAEALAICRAGLALVHAGPVDDGADPMDQVFQGLHRALGELAGAGFPLERVVLDPGLSAGKTPEQVRRILSRLRELRSLGRPLMVTLTGLNLPACSAGVQGALAAAAALAAAYGANIVSVPPARLGEAAGALRLAAAVAG